MYGPYPIFCRGHSGGRLACEAFIHNQIAMGHVASDRKDTEFFAIQNPLMYELILNAYTYINLPNSQKAHYQALMQRCLEQFIQQEVPDSQQPFGWKLGISLFTMPLVLETFPNAKVIHLIRDGRDVMLSRLEARFANMHDSANRLVVFGDADIDQFDSKPLTPETIAANRNALEMQHWVTAVRYGLQGRAYGDRYLEVNYEAICQNPMTEFKKIFDFLELPFLEETKNWLKTAIYHTRIGKWQSLSAEQLTKPLEIGETLLKELGYW